MKSPRVIMLGQELWFPDPEQVLQPGASRLADDGLVAVGGDLSVARLRLAYRNGIFPWSVNPITWWSPDPRGILELDQFHVSRSLGRTLRKQPFQVTFNRAFREVICECASQPRTGNWITPAFLGAYTRLHDAGFAHSVECWRGGALVGGVYGVATGGSFSGESMFHKVNDASKVALYHLVEHLKSNGFALFDTQMVTPVTRRLGAIEISRKEFLKRLRQAVKMPCTF